MANVKISALPNLTTLSGSDVLPVVSSGTTYHVSATNIQSFVNSSSGNIIPAVDNVYFLGNATNRWANLWLGPGTIYITDSNVASNVTAELTVLNGVLQVNGVPGLQANLVAGTTSLTLSKNGNISMIAAGSTSNAMVLFPGGVSMAGNLTVAGNIVGTIQTIANVANLVNGNTTLTMNTNGPVVISPGGVANVLNVNSQGANISGNLTITGNTYSNPTYGSFWDTTTQTNSNVGNAIPMSYNSSDGHYGVTITGAENTQITIGKTGLYNIQFSAQLAKADAGSDELFIWLDKNGTSVPESATSVWLTGNGAKDVAAWNFVVSATAGDYYRLMWMSPDANASIVYVANSSPVPGIPSIILTVVPVGP